MRPLRHFMRNDAKPAHASSEIGAVQGMFAVILLRITKVEHRLDQVSTVATGSRPQPIGQWRSDAV